MLSVLLGSIEKQECVNFCGQTFLEAKSDKPERVSPQAGRDMSAKYQHGWSKVNLFFLKSIQKR